VCQRKKARTTKYTKKIRAVRIRCRRNSSRLKYATTIFVVITIISIVLQLNAVLMADAVEAAAIPNATYEHKRAEENTEWVHLAIRMDCASQLSRCRTVNPISLSGGGGHREINENDGLFEFRSCTCRTA
jgi:hypothetical protein